NLTLGDDRDTFDVNNGEGIAFLPAGTLPGQTVDYAFVTGLNFYIRGNPAHDPDASPFHPTGSNVGIIRDPFRVQGPPELVAAPRAIPSGDAVGLALSSAGRFLYASYAARDAVLVYDVKEMLDVVNNPGDAALTSAPVDDVNFRIDTSDLPSPAGSPV